MNNLTLQTRQTSELLLKIARNLRVARLIDEVKSGLTTSQLMVLLILKDKKNTAFPIGSLARQLSISFPAASGIIDRLYKEKLIKREQSSQDRRLILVKLTNTGKKAVEKLLNVFEEFLFNIFKRIPETEGKTIIKAIERVFEFSIVLSKDVHSKKTSLQKTAV